MGHITFIVGGARSGKSSHAVEVIESHGPGKTAFIATCEALDDEMRKRIELHKKSRPDHWDTFEAPLDVASIIKTEGITRKFQYILIDCITLFVSNMFLKEMDMTEIYRRIDDMLDILKEGDANVVIVSNEVGLGIVPENGLARDFRDIAGRVNQKIAKVSDRVFFMVSGIPMRIK